MKKPLSFALFSGLWLGCLAAAASAQEAGDRRASRPNADLKAQSAVAAVNDAGIYLAQLRRCEGLGPERRAACVEAARR